MDKIASDRMLNRRVNRQLNRRQFNKLALGTSAGLGLASLPSAHAAPSPIAPNQTWHTWRGPNGNNVAETGATIPDQLTADNIKWTSPVPGRGHSSPIVTEDHIYLTTADKSAGVQGVLAFERANGKQLWSQVVHRGGLPTENHAKNTEASSSVAFDGSNLFAVFYNTSALQLTSLTPTGKIRWQQNLGHYEPKRYKYGYAASPCIYQDKVIVVGDYDGQPFLTARDLKTGRSVWRVERPVTISFSSPIVAKTSGRDQLLLSGAEKIMSYDPENGKLLWETPGTTFATCGTMVWDDERVYASGGYPKPETICVKSDGSGEVVWANNQKCYEQSMLIHEGFIYAVTDAGVAHCWRAVDGETMWRQRLGGDYSSSPVLVGNSIHVFNEQGSGFVFAPDPTGYRELGRNKLADDVFPTPSVIGNVMYHRFAKREAQGRKEYLVAIS